MIKLVVIAHDGTPIEIKHEGQQHFAWCDACLVGLEASGELTAAIALGTQHAFIEHGGDGQ